MWELDFTPEVWLFPLEGQKHDTMEHMCQTSYLSKCGMCVVEGVVDLLANFPVPGNFVQDILSHTGSVALPNTITFSFLPSACYVSNLHFVSFSLAIAPPQHDNDIMMVDMPSWCPMHVSALPQLSCR